jgi:hypothetical protein
MTKPLNQAFRHLEAGPAHPAHSKEAKILAVLRNNPRGLNRFEAEQLGDHVLPSTIATLRKKRNLFSDYWETVPTRFDLEVRAKRYIHIGSR